MAIGTGSKANPSYCADDWLHSEFGVVTVPPVSHIVLRPLDATYDLPGAGHGEMSRRRSPSN
jgi:hypothetical protein